MMNTVIELIKYRLVAPVLCSIFCIRYYKTQCIEDNEIKLYNIITNEWIDYHVK